jgi:hypothetical protein
VPETEDELASGAKRRNPPAVKNAVKGKAKKTPEAK